MVKPQIRLSAINPAELARDTVNALRVHVSKITFGLNPTFQWLEKQSGDGPEHSDLGQTVQTLTRYAQTGDTDDWGDAAGAHGAMLSVLTDCYGSALGTRFEGLEDLAGEVEPEEGLGLVLLAAMARCALDGVPLPGRPHDTVTPREVAVLACLSTRQALRLVALGELPATGGGDGPGRPSQAVAVAVADARMWLNGRGVRGF